MNNTPQKSPILKAAEYWTGQGRPVFPLRPKLKTPATGDGFKSATCKPDQILEWFGGSSGFNLGLATGNGLLVIDVDVKNGINGLENLKALEQELGALPTTLKITTPSGGIHLFFNYPESNDVRGSASKLAPGIDIRANGGYVATAPSILENGAYRIEDRQPIADLPTAWLERLLRKPEPPKPPPISRPLPDHDQQSEELRDALKSIDAHDHDTWVKVGMALHNLGDTGLQLWDDWSRTASNYSAKEITKRWKSFGGTSVRVETVFYLASEKGWQNPRKGKQPPSTAKSTDTPDNANAHDTPTHDDKQAGITDLIEQALEQAENGKPEAMQDESVLIALAKVRLMNELAYQRYRSRIQRMKTKPFSLSFLDKETKPPKQPRYTEQEESSGEGAGHRQGKADLLIEMVKQWGEVFTDESGVAYVSFMVEPVDRETGELLPTHVETWPLDSDKFQQKCGREFYKRFGTVAGDSAIKEAFAVLAAEADEGPTEEVYLRCAMPPDTESVFIDLGDDNWQVIRITAAGWSVISSADCPVKFRRVRHSRPLPFPESGGDVADLWKHLNIQGDDAKKLILAWLLAAMLTGVPYPVLEIIAGQGSAKSTTQERLKVLLDPNHSNLRKEPDSIRDLSISAGSNHVISLNNMSHMNTALQDFLCSMSTGGGDAARKLYSTADEVVWDIRRPVMLNGINQLVTRPDLADRTVCIELQKITTYTDEHTLKVAWEQDYPKLTGALYTLLAGVLRELPNVQLTKPPRMADFAKLGTALVKALGEDVDFVAIFNRNRDAVVQRGVEASPVALALLSFMNAYPVYNGTLGELMQRLDDFQPKHYDRAAWPKSPRGLGEVLRRLEPALTVYGIEIERGQRSNGGYGYRICKIDARTDTVETEL